VHHRQLKVVLAQLQLCRGFLLRICILIFVVRIEGIFIREYFTTVKHTLQFTYVELLVSWKEGSYYVLCVW